MRKQGYYWAEVFNEKEIVRVEHVQYEDFTEVLVKSFEYGYVDEKYVEFLHDDPLT